MRRCEKENKEDRRKRKRDLGLIKDWILIYITSSMPIWCIRIKEKLKKKYFDSIVEIK